MGKFISKIILTFAVLFSICFVSYKFYCKNKIKEIITNDIEQSSMLSLMLETDIGTGQYEMNTSNIWPVDNYIFNSELSKCENDSTLSWDSRSKQVVFKGRVTDKCYVYFDKYNFPKISDINSTNTLNSIRLNVKPKVGTSAISKFYYSFDGGKTYAESVSDTYTFDNLERDTDYNIKVIAEDIKGIQSDVYEKNVRTTVLDCQNPTLEKEYDGTPLAVVDYPVEYFFDYYTISDNSSVYMVTIEHSHTPEYEFIYVPNSNQTITLPWGTITEVGTSVGGVITLTFKNGLSCDMEIWLRVVAHSVTPSIPEPPNPNPNPARQTFSSFN